MFRVCWEVKLVETAESHNVSCFVFFFLPRSLNDQRQKHKFFQQNFHGKGGGGKRQRHGSATAAMQREAGYVLVDADFPALNSDEKDAKDVSLDEAAHLTPGRKGSRIFASHFCPRLWVKDGGNLQRNVSIL
jgi:hypothetical protein